MAKQRLLRRKELSGALHAAGFPIGAGTLDKLCAPSVNEGPPVEYWWGKQAIHDFDKAKNWARSRMSPTRRKLQGVNW